MSATISKRTLTRLPLYLSYLKSLSDRPEQISAAAIAKELGLSHVLVRKDLAYVGPGGRPRTGYITDELISDIERFMGYKELSSAVIIGAGKLSAALLEYDGFIEYGLEIAAAFGGGRSECLSCSGKPFFPLERLNEICSRLNVHIGIIAVPAGEAQKAADLLVESGIQAIWNLTPAHINVPDTVLVENENMGASLALLSKHLLKNFCSVKEKENEGKQAAGA